MISVSPANTGDFKNTYTREYPGFAPNSSGRLRSRAVTIIFHNTKIYHDFGSDNSIRANHESICLCRKTARRPIKEMIDEIIILERLKNQDIKAFKELCFEFLQPLEDYAYSLVNDARGARDLSVDVMGRLWATNGFANASLPLLEFLKEEIRKASKL